MYIYQVNRAFQTNAGATYQQGQLITESVYNELDESQAFVKKIWDGTQKELDEYNQSKTAKSKTIETTVAETPSKKGKKAKFTLPN